MTIKKGGDKMVLQMYPVHYHGKSQIPASKLTSDDELSSDKDAVVSQEEASFKTTQHHRVVYQYGGPKEYLIYLSRYKKI